MNFLQKLLLEQALKSFAAKAGIAVGYVIELLPLLFEAIKNGQELLGSAEFKAFLNLAIRKFQSMDKAQAKEALKKLQELVKS